MHIPSHPCCTVLTTWHGDMNNRGVFTSGMMRGINKGMGNEDGLCAAGKMTSGRAPIPKSPLEQVCCCPEF